MKFRSLIHGYSCYSLKVVIGAVILVVVAVITTPKVFQEKIRNKSKAEEA